MTVFLILHYMVDKETKKCVDSILKLNGSKKVVIVDNCSSNNSYKILSNYYNTNDDVVVLQNSENAGYASGNNFGYDYIKNNFTDVDFIVAMNNDMEIKQIDFIEKIKEIYSKEKFFVLAPDVYSVSAKIHQNPEPRTIRDLKKIEEEIKRVENITISQLRVKGFIKRIPYVEKIIKSIKNKKRRNSLEYTKKSYNKTLHGSCLIFSKLFVEKREYIFYPKTKFYCEAQILDYQCEKNNWLRLYDPQIKVLHYEDMATNATYKSYVKKSIFMNSCMKQSLSAFKDLVISDNKDEKD